MLTVKNLTYGPPQSPRLQTGLEFTVRPGELLHVSGANGAGKSLLARVILGLSPAAPESKIHCTFANHRYLPQMQNKAAHLPYTLGDVLSFGGEKKSLDLINPDQLNLSWNRASGGERQRTLLTRFFGQEGDLLVLDEPFNHLDLDSKLKVRELIQGAFSEKKVGAILISHDDSPSHWLRVPVQTLHLNNSGDL